MKDRQKERKKESKTEIQNIICVFLSPKSWRFISRWQLKNGLVIAGHFDGGGSVCIKKPSIRPNSATIGFYSIFRFLFFFSSRFY